MPVCLQHIPVCFVPSQGHWENSAPVMLPGSAAEGQSLFDKWRPHPLIFISCGEWHSRQLLPISTLSDIHASSSQFIHLHFTCQVAFAPAHVHGPPTTSHHEAQKCQKCDRGCQCLIQAQLIWVIRPNSHCRNQRWSRTFPVGNMPCSCISPVICKTAAVREVVLLNCIVHLTSGLLGVQHTRDWFWLCRPGRCRRTSLI